MRPQNDAEKKAEKPWCGHFALACLPGCLLKLCKPGELSWVLDRGPLNAPSHLDCTVPEHNYGTLSAISMEEIKKLSDQRELLVINYPSTITFFNGHIIDESNRSNAIGKSFFVSSTSRGCNFLITQLSKISPFLALIICDSSPFFVATMLNSKLEGSNK
jgi:hypothetical protein